MPLGAIILSNPSNGEGSLKLVRFSETHSPD
jgi:hypothetical protein